MLIVETYFEAAAKTLKIFETKRKKYEKCLPPELIFRWTKAIPINFYKKDQGLNKNYWRAYWRIK